MPPPPAARSRAGTGAATASTTRETVARVLSQLAQDGIAERKSKTLYIRQVDRLRQLCDKVPAVIVKTGG